MRLLKCCRERSFATFAREVIDIRKLICLTILLCLVLSGCAAEQNNRQLQQAVEFRAAVMAAETCQFSADVTVNFSDHVYQFTLACTYLPDGEAVLSVVEPESIAGISARISPDGADVEYDGVMISFGQLANGHVAPMALPWVLGNAWTKGYISSAGKDGDSTLITCLLGYEEKQLTVETWLGEGNVPVHSEIYYDGQCCITAVLRDFNLQ